MNSGQVSGREQVVNYICMILKNFLL